MTLTIPLTERHDSCGAMVVRRPRRIDAMTMTLRNAFADEGGMPIEIAQALAALDRIPCRR